MDERVITGSLLLVLLTITPGADLVLIAKVALADGRRAAFLASLGICSGLPVHATASALGISAILATSALAFTIVKILGAAYLVFLGLQTLSHARRSVPIAAETVSGSGPRARSVFLHGLLSNLLNPKVALFYFNFLPQFIAPDEPMLARSWLFAALHAAMGFVWLFGYAYVFDRLGSIMRRPAVRRWLERLTGIVLVGLGVRLAIERR